MISLVQERLANIEAIVMLREIQLDSDASVSLFFSNNIVKEGATGISILL